jgi:sugar phosphate permease
METTDVGRLAAQGRSSARARATIVALVAGYVAIYLCRKNLSVAVPLLQESFGATKAEVGRIASIGTLAYALGKLALGPVVDRAGGRAGFVAALAAVATFGALGALSPSLALLTAAYACNRFAGAGGWPSMMKLVPTWFDAGKGTVVAVLSLSYVFGGALATLLAREVVEHGGGFRAVLGVPSLVVVPIAVACAAVLRTGPLSAAHQTSASVSAAPSVRSMLLRPAFLVVCALSFTLTLVRESFNTWSVDFLASIQAANARSLGAAALQSTGFDLAGAVSILGAGYAYDRTPRPSRRWVIGAVLALLAVVLYALPGLAAAAPGSGVWLVGAVGLLVYGPYSLLAGVLAVEAGGVAAAATAAAVIDGIGYLAGVLAGETLGRLLDVGGYGLGFHCLAAITGVSAVTALGLRGEATP